MTDTTSPPSSIRVDRDGDLWQPAGNGKWRCRTEPTQYLTPDMLDADYGPTVELVPATRVTELEEECDALRRQLHEAQTAIRTLVGDGGILTEIRDTVRQILPAKPTPPVFVPPMCVEPVGPGGAYCGQDVGKAGYLRLRCNDHAAVSHNGPISDTGAAGVAHNDNAPAVALTQAVLDRYQPAWSDGLVLRCRRCWNLLPQVRPLSALIAAAHVHATDECPELPDAPATPSDCRACTGPLRETAGMVCQTCGTDYAPDDDHDDAPAAATATGGGAQA